MNAWRNEEEKREGEVTIVDECNGDESGAERIGSTD